jgi:hypothetical protein
MAQAANTPTVDSSYPPDRQRRSAIVRWLFIAALTAFLLAAMLGFFGLKDRAVRSSNGPYKLEVQYTAISRAGLRGGWTAKVSVPLGTKDPVTLAVDTKYIEMLEINRVVPEPSVESTDGDTVLWQFDAPDSGHFAVEVDADIPPNRHRGGSGRVAVRVGKREVVAVTLETRVFP